MRISSANLLYESLASESSFPSSLTSVSSIRFIIIDSQEALSINIYHTSMLLRASQNWGGSLARFAIALPPLDRIDSILCVCVSENVLYYSDEIL